MRTCLALSLAAITLLGIDRCSSAALTGYWSFDSGFTNEQGNSALDGSAIGTGTSITSSPGEFQVGGGGLRIDNAPGATDYVDVAGNVLVGQPGSVVNTVVGWYRFDDISLDGADERNFVWETAPTSWALSLGIRDDGFDKKAQWFTKDPSTGGDIAFMPAVNDGGWHHAAIVIDEASEMLTYYHDGFFWDQAIIAGLSLDRAGATGFHIGNHRAGDGGRNWDGYIDEVAVFSQILSDSQIAGLFNQTLTIGDIPTTELTFLVNRDTRAVTLTNNTGSAIDLDSYAMSSVVGGLDPGQWTSIAENGDADSGGSVDPANTWSISTATNTELAEASDGATGASVADGQSIELGAVWIPSPTEDVFLTYFSGGEEKSASLVYSGNNGSPFAPGDLDFDGEIGPGDWTAFLVGHGGDFASLSPAQAYGLGDLDGDLDNDMFDFLEFELLYDAENGQGALAGLMAGVPEPATLVLVALCMIVACGWTGLWRRRARAYARASSYVFIIILTGLFAAPASADLVASWTFDNDFGASSGGLLFDLTPFNGATAGDPGGMFGNAATFERANQEYAFTSGNVLTQGPGQDHSYSAWYRLDVADITGSDRYFVLETTAADTPSGTEAWSISYGLRDLGAGDVGQVYTIADSGAAPNIDFFDGGNQVWHNIIVTYDADGGFVDPGLHTVYLDGLEVASFENPDPLESVEGLVIGGHRAGTGRNFDGQIDDVGIFDNVLSADDIALLQTNSVLDFAPDTDELTLSVNRGSGAMTLTNTGGNAVRFNSYQIDSPLGSLDPDGWNSFDDQNLDPVDGGDEIGETWDEGGSVSPNRLIESFLLGNTELASGASLTLGNAYDETVDAQDLVFRFNSLDNGPFSGLVEYSVGFEADFDSDGDVDGDDFLLWQTGFGTPSGAEKMDGDYDNDGDVDGDDFLGWQAEFGSGGGDASAAVPEPAAFVSFFILAMVISLVRSHRLRR